MIQQYQPLKHDMQVNHSSSKLRGLQNMQSVPLLYMVLWLPNGSSMLVLFTP